MIDPDETAPYAVQPDAGRFRVEDWEGNVALTCGDLGSAEHYAALMNQAFRRGHKAGFRKAKNDDGGHRA